MALAQKQRRDSYNGLTSSLCEDHPSLSPLPLEYRISYWYSPKKNSGLGQLMDISSGCWTLEILVRIPMRLGNRSLISLNIVNAYVSGMKEDLNIHGNQYNLLTTFFTCGYPVGQIPSQLLLTKCMRSQIDLKWHRLLIPEPLVRPSYYLPAVEFLWTIITFCFAAVQSTKQVFALRFLIGMLESPFAVGVITLMGSWYTPRGKSNGLEAFSPPINRSGWCSAELAKRIAIFYSASYAASMFSGYLQAGIYQGLDGHLGLPGWRWLFIFCGIISLPTSIWGLYAIPDSPYTTRARWLSGDSKHLYIDRMKNIDRRAPAPLSWAKIKKTMTHWPIYIISLMLM